MKEDFLLWAAGRDRKYIIKKWLVQVNLYLTIYIRSLPLGYHA